MQIATITDGRVVPIVVMLDEPLHTDDHPFCGDPECGCHEDHELVQEHLILPMDAGQIDASEAFRRYWGERSGR